MRALRALLPGAVVLGAALAFTAMADEPALLRITETYGLVLTGAGLALAWVFHRSRAFIVLGLFAWLDLAGLVGAVAPGTQQTEGAGFVAYATVVIGLLAVVAVLRDRGVLSHVGIVQLLVIGAVTVAWHFVLADPGRVGGLAARPEVAPLRVEVVPGVPTVTLVVVAIAVLAVLYGAQRFRGPVERAFAWSLVLLVLALRPDATVGQSEVLVMAASLAVTIGIVETSYVMAYRDELTGLPGRRALMQYLGGLQGLYTVAMVDVDHFKKFNDKHGHDVGDQVLKLVASRLARAPGGAKAYRYGGEEFTLLLPGRRCEDAIVHLEAVRASIEEARFSMRSWRRPRAKPDEPKPHKQAKPPKRLSVTVSIGAADSADGETDSEVVIKRADEALYRAKKKGRNRVSA